MKGREGEGKLTFPPGKTTLKVVRVKHPEVFFYTDKNSHHMFFVRKSEKNFPKKKILRKTVVPEYLF